MATNTTKLCPKCDNTKPINNFNKNKNRKDGLQDWCKQCKHNQYKKYYPNNKDKFKEINQKFKENNPNYQKEYQEKNKEKISEYYQDPLIKKRRRNYIKKWEKERRKDPIKKLKKYLTNYVQKSIKNSSSKKLKSSFEIVGVESWEQLREHIEKQWEDGMSWDNHGIGKDNTTWHIDHIIPISSAKTEQDVYKLNHYTNLRPMWGSDNIRKRDKIIKN